MVSSIYPLSLLIASLVAGAIQWYLFSQVRKFMRAQAWRRKARRMATAAVALFFLLMFIPYLYYPLILGRSSAADSPVVLYGLLYPFAIWSLGSFLMFLLLAPLRGTRFLLLRLRKRSQPLLGKPLATEASGPRRALRPEVSPSLPDARGPIGSGPQGGLSPGEGVSGLSRRGFLRWSVAGVIASPLAATAYGTVYGRNAYQVVERPILLRDLPPALDGFTIVQITDLHAGPYMGEEDIRRYVRRANSLRPDLVALTGDLVHSSPRFLGPCARALSDLRAPLGVFACLGNHEYWVGLEAVKAALEEAGIPLLVNEGRVLRARGSRLNLAGLDDIRHGHANFDLALSGLDPGAPTLLLSHRPEVFPEASRRGVDLTLAGHYHGGQVTFRVLGVPITPARLLTQYVEGLFQLERSLLYVSRGLGTTGTPVRIGARPELTVIRLRSPHPAG